MAAYGFDDAGDFLDTDEFAAEVTYTVGSTAATSSVTMVIAPGEELGHGAPDGFDGMYAPAAGKYAVGYVQASDVASPVYAGDTVTQADGTVWRVENRVKEGSMWRVSLSRDVRAGG